MPSTKSSPMRVSASLSFIHPIVLCWLAGTASLTLGGCVSPQTYESAEQEAKARATDLAQAQADIQGLEQQRDAAQAANQRDERALASLKNELHSIQASFDQIRKDNQARLADLQHRIAVLRARHQLMLKEIAETKRYEKQLETLTAQRERAMASVSFGSEARATTVEGHESEPRMVAVITPRTPQSDALLSSPAPAPLGIGKASRRHCKPIHCRPSNHVDGVACCSPSKQSRETRPHEVSGGTLHCEHSGRAPQQFLVLRHDRMASVDVRLDLVLGSQRPPFRISAVRRTCLERRAVTIT